MTIAPPALFDVDSLRRRVVPTFGAPRRAGSVVVLGSRQRVGDLDRAALERDGVGTARRRGGGGAVLLRPDDCWVELWLPAGLGRHGDVRAAARVVGEWWWAALAALGVDAAVHGGGMVAADQGAVACFAGLGPGEVTHRGRKLVGLSQWRTREGSLVSTVLAARPPSALAAYLSQTAAPVPALDDATCILDVAPSLSGEDLAAALQAAVRDAHPDLAVDPAAFV